MIVTYYHKGLYFSDELIGKTDFQIIKIVMNVSEYFFYNIDNFPNLENHL